MKGKVDIWCEPSDSGSDLLTVMFLRAYIPQVPHKIEFNTVYRQGEYEQAKQRLIDRFKALPEPEDIEIGGDLHGKEKER